MSISKTCRPVTLVKKGGSGMKKKLESTKKSFPVLIDLNMQIGEPRLRVVLALLFFLFVLHLGVKKRICVVRASMLPRISTFFCSLSLSCRINNILLHANHFLMLFTVFLFFCFDLMFYSWDV